jgi:hypothetical protein
MASQLQPLDVSINKPFKHLVSKHCDAWLNKDNHILTLNKSASVSIIVEWISKAWKKVALNIIPKPFLKCCLSKAEGETQDDILLDDSEQSGKGPSSSANESVNEGSLDKLSD